MQKNCIRETLNLSTCGDRSTNILIFLLQMGVSVMCHLSPVTCHMSLKPAATAMDPSPARFPTMHNGMLLLILT